MPEGYLSLLGYTGIYFAIAAVLAFGLVVPRAYRTFTKLGAMPAPDATHPESAARRELARECDFAENVLRTVPVIVLLLDPSGRIRYCNAHFERLTGYRLEEIRGESSFSRFVPPGEQEEIRRVLEAAVAGDQTNGNVNSLLTRDGAEREIEWHVRPLLDEHGEVENLVSVGLDVTESSRLIGELRESERRLNEAQRLAKTGSWELDAANGSLNWSDETYRIVERDRESFEPSYAAVLEMTHPDDRLRVERAYRRSLETGEPYEITHRIQTPGGGVKHVLETGSGQFDDSGRLLRSSGTVQDITELQLARRELECYRDHLEELVEERTAELREEHRRHSFIVNAAVDGFFIADEEGKLTECNQAFCSMLGYTREELLSLSIPDLEAIENEDDVAAHIAELIEQGHVRFDTRHRRKDGTEIDVEIQATYRFLEGGSYELYVFVHDISKRVERARELAASRDEAERANRAKSEFLSRMSHDLRTPLNAILGFAELLESDVAEPLTETQADNIGEVLKAGRHLLSMIDDILDLSRADQGRLEVDAKNVDLPAVLSEVAAELEAVAARRNVEVATSLGGLGMARADERRIRQVLSILLSSAVERSPMGGQVTVQTVPSVADRLEILITDGGPGMEPDVLDRIFEPFESRGSDRGGGRTGEGLPLARSLLVAMGGDITAESVPGEGTVFRLSLPRGEESGAQSDLPRKARTVMYVEDNRVNLLLMRKMLEARPNIRLVTAGSAEECLQTVRGIMPDLILLDINLPGADGFETIRHLRAEPATVSIPVVAVTAAVLPEDKESYRAAGFDGLVEKPILREQLFDVVDAEYGD